MVEIGTAILQEEVRAHFSDTDLCTSCELCATGVKILKLLQFLRKCGGCGTSQTARK
jgi:hypothetical protein